MTDEDKQRADVREFLAALSPSERRRIVNFFLMQIGLEQIPENVNPVIKGGLDRALPGNALAVQGGK